MSLVKTWYEPQAAAEKFGLSMDQLLAWVDEGLIRCEREKEVLVCVNIDDVRLEVEAMVRSQ